MNLAVSNEQPLQKRLGAKGLIALITLLSAFVPLSTDLYLPALPKMGAQFDAPAHVINLTLMLFFIGLCGGNHSLQRVEEAASLS